VLLVEASAVTVHARLSSRVANAPSVELIRRLAESEQRCASETSRVLEIPLFTAAGDRAFEDQSQALVERLWAFRSGR
jgi:hypothetical protein